MFRGLSKSATSKVINSNSQRYSKSPYIIPKQAIQCQPQLPLQSNTIPIGSNQAHLHTIISQPRESNFVCSGTTPSSSFAPTRPPRAIGNPPGSIKRPTPPGSRPGSRSAPPSPRLNNPYKKNGNDNNDDSIRQQGKHNGQGHYDYDYDHYFTSGQNKGVGDGTKREFDDLFAGTGSTSHDLKGLFDVAESQQASHQPFGKGNLGQSEKTLSGPSVIGSGQSNLFDRHLEKLQQSIKENNNNNNITANQYNKNGYNQQHINNPIKGSRNEQSPHNPSDPTAPIMKTGLDNPTPPTSTHPHHPTSPLDLVAAPPPDDLPIQPGSSITVGDFDRMVTRVIYILIGGMVISTMAKTSPTAGVSYLESLSNPSLSPSRLKIIDYQHPEIDSNGKISEWYSFKMTMAQMRKFLYIFPSWRSVYISPLLHRLGLHTSNLNLDQSMECTVTGDVGMVDEDILNVQRYCLQNMFILLDYKKALSDLHSLERQKSFWKRTYGTIRGLFPGAPSQWAQAERLQELKTRQMFVLQQTLIDYQEAFGVDFFPNLLTIPLQQHLARCKKEAIEPGMPNVVRTKDGTVEKMEWIYDESSPIFTPDYSKIPEIVTHVEDLINEALYYIDQDITAVPSGITNNTNNHIDTTASILTKQAFLAQSLQTLARLTTMRDQLEGYAHMSYNSNIFQNSMKNPLFSQRVYTIPPAVKREIRTELELFRRENPDLGSNTTNPTPKSPHPPFARDGLHSLGVDLPVLEKLQSVCEQFHIFWPFFPKHLFFLHQKETFAIRSGQLLQAYHEKFLEKTEHDSRQFLSDSSDGSGISQSQLQSSQGTARALAPALELVSLPINRQYSEYFPHRKVKGNDLSPIVKGIKPRYKLFPNMHYNEDYRREFDQYLTHIGHMTKRVRGLNTPSSPIPVGNDAFVKHGKGSVQTNSINAPNLSESSSPSSKNSFLQNGLYTDPISGQNVLHYSSLALQDEFSSFDLALAGVYNEHRGPFSGLISGGGRTATSDDTNNGSSGGLLGLNFLSKWTSTSNSTILSPNQSTPDSTQLPNPIPTHQGYDLTRLNHVDYPIDLFSSLLRRQRMIEIPSSSNQPPNSSSSYFQPSPLTTTTKVSLSPSFYGPIGLENMLTMGNMPVISELDYLALVENLFSKNRALRTKLLQRQESQLKNYIAPVQHDAHHASLRGINNASSKRNSPVRNFGEVAPQRRRESTKPLQPGPDAGFSYQPKKSGRE